MTTLIRADSNTYKVIGKRLVNGTTNGKPEKMTEMLLQKPQGKKYYRMMVYADGKRSQVGMAIPATLIDITKYEK